ncbi:pyrimidine dimer DNA glycosylase/endonuclease V [Tsukamurella sp. 1534]|uniref:pyrimidine dimer DNA glycosylase/endonuclease V n=1 Tax=Tsukamurella sp. 1534 TaxID=1151061 RepID=UPI0002F4EC1B|nr:pyrimidine dimer DNA glycosylase/endonuclease V [Tsukamurella sp. 1534]
MRIWSLHPRYLDRQGLLACWRETLLAQGVLAGRTRGYTRHPQLERFREAADPLAAVCVYLAAVAEEADARGYAFDRTRIDDPAAVAPAIDVTTGQLDLEWAHLTAKLEARSPEVAERWRAVERPDTHRSFRAVPGPVAPWERARPDRDD